MAICTASDASESLIEFCNKHGDLLTNLKLQKLLYYVQAWHLAFFAAPMFDEDFEAWVHGPVEPGTYRRFKQFGQAPIIDSYTPAKLPFAQQRHLVEVMKVYGGMSAFELERRTHQEEPWLAARRGIPADEPSTAVIDKEYMRRFYRSRLDG
jgi:uncharacterized phage-associated protein